MKKDSREQICRSFDCCHNRVTHKNFEAHVDLHVHPNARNIHGQASVLHVHDLRHDTTDA